MTIQVFAVTQGYNQQKRKDHQQYFQSSRIWFWCKTPFITSKVAVII